MAETEEMIKALWCVYAKETQAYGQPKGYVVISDTGKNAVQIVCDFCSDTGNSITSDPKNWRYRKYNSEETIVGVIPA